ncbi:amylo-alpha-1,6-glucosidase [Spirulina subsalsa FACHB-351]|uniref:Amylo-alpha-1,6-glucosidase n=1 Tax=Spirulina subsalsa FACHB-351 TaxID=234711 RepID=A0ABT3L2X9_9CYAN|nr:amylo-alpha-1,6-glucosidase [Spirulina subsalsa]MCW6035807.1 amylo-alpha-1,6-glucosidase [Spirulina subsalsa FACHB-351]
MSLEFGREICGNLPHAETREWLVTNGIGGYAAGTVGGLLTRRYHGLLMAALQPPLGRTLLLSKLEESVIYHQQTYLLATNRWHDAQKTVFPRGYQWIERFHLDGTIPVWTFACGDSLLEKRVWMEQGQNTTYIRYTVKRASAPLTLQCGVFVNYRDSHYDTRRNDWPMDVDVVDKGLKVVAFPEAVPLYVLTAVQRQDPKSGYVRPQLVQGAQWTIDRAWYENYDLAVERERGLCDREDHCHVARVKITLQVGESFTVVASTEKYPSVNSQQSLEQHKQKELKLLDGWYNTLARPTFRHSDGTLGEQNPYIVPDWVEHLVLAADQFIVDRTLPDDPEGKTILAGYPWFGDWGRDTMISLPGLTLATGRPEIARKILATFTHYLDQGMLPNVFPDDHNRPSYNTVDAILWYFEALYAYVQASHDLDFIGEIFPALEEVIDWHERGTRYNIKLDPRDGLLYAGSEESQLTWMDAKVGDWVVTPRTGKPIEVNALWYNALVIMGYFAKELGKPYGRYEELAHHTLVGFSRFWNYSTGYCYDVLDTPTGHAAQLRPNQIFAVSLPGKLGPLGGLPLLLPREQKAVVDIVAQTLLTSYGLRSLGEQESEYIGLYKGDRIQRDGAYHQGTVWGWLIGHFVQAHLQVYHDPDQAATFLQPFAHHLQAACVGSLSEIFDGNPPFTPRGAFAQAWTVAEVLRAWLLVR